MGSSKLLWIAVYQHEDFDGNRDDGLMSAEILPFTCYGTPSKHFIIPQCPHKEELNHHQCKDVHIVGGWKIEDIPIAPETGKVHVCMTCDAALAEQELRDIGQIGDLEGADLTETITGRCPECRGLTYLLELP